MCAAAALATVGLAAALGACLYADPQERPAEAGAADAPSQADTGVVADGSPQPVADASLPDGPRPDAPLTDAADAGADTGEPDAGGPDASDPDAGAPPPGPSCETAGEGRTNCGSALESCCVSPVVPAGSFIRSYDGVTPLYSDPQYVATVSEFRLDKYEVTVGRFRAFVAAVVAGWRPAAGSGKHSHLHGGAGLSIGPGAYESGWDVAWNSHLAATKAEWDAVLQCSVSAANNTWAPAPGGKERHPIVCVDWYHAAAFCNWDRGFLPSEAEWNYAAAGGDQQRVFPWSVPASAATITSAHAVFNDRDAGVQAVGSRPLGVGRFEQLDLAGNVWEALVDSYFIPYVQTPCVDCAPEVSSEPYRATRGGSFVDDDSYLYVGRRNGGLADLQYNGSRGVRCARAP